MLALAASPLGIRTLVVDGSADACAGQVTDLVVADWFDDAALDTFAGQVDVITFDFENVPAAVAERLASKVAVFPNPRALAVAQDRLSEKTLFRECGLGTPDFEPVDTREDLVRAVERIGAPAVLKTRRLGYDGKGQFRLKTVADIDAAWAALGEAAGQVGLILEAFVPFEREVSVVAVRGRDGAFRSYPLTRNWHVDGVLSLSLAPAPGSTDELERAANAHARKVAEALDYVGVFALELFVCNGRLLGNEMAPRVHNSGHWTIEGAHTSQFENHVRAVLGLPLGDTGVRGPSAMLNWIGEMPDPAPVLNVADGHWHDYGKEARPGRKVGHATVCAPDAGSLRGKLAEVGKGLGREDQVAPAIAALA
ncbi:5-(carboxyamino)imidazole ribonucleotide synthase [Luteibacter aegosomaticola]|uniref:5-(carboxyamino)imidazole ribonucleotide synthase n=1 Tax=Luteibacter aegosomaticola TaxID=2911538 RepID=UPI001FF7A2F6|nr:5-(carboxyamino)imidazole ribonucleotide synthase [Luteibacter aegosomaticola]UPG92313.1 5-(carboxyamino)imidazole ribonucleotide synthase [Luteibacter aegosomaticola]